MNELLSQIRNCTVCKSALPYFPRPVIQASSSCKILIIGQAPGQKVHHSGIPWNDASGENLRSWLGVEEQDFYNEKLFALVPMGFCYPGTTRSGDLPPRPECAPQWHQQVLQSMSDIRITLLIGLYAQNYYLGHAGKNTLTETVKNYKEYLPKYMPLPHPSPRNNIWQKKNSWFMESLIPALRRTVLPLVN